MAYTTNCDADYFASTFHDSVSYNVINTDGSVGTVREIDPFSVNIHRLMENLTLFTTQTYTGQQFTTMVYKVYGNTTLIRLVLLYNGLLSRTELRPGMVIKFPLKEQIDEFIRNTKTAIPRGRVEVI
jgi:hypothetical protein